jgi:geranylgeranyl diphosphate synthase type II
MQIIENYQKTFIAYLKEKSVVKEPNGLYEPIDYILQLGGKRLRPVLTMLSTHIFGGDYKKALDAALAIEVFHNFTLIHDDIMDEAPLRRGKKTVHEKWDLNTGVLSGDAMLIQSYQYLESYDDVVFKQLINLFSKTAIEVCEGQQYDVDFETRTDVSIPEYLKMIEYKTSVLVAAAMKMGAIIARASQEDRDGVYEFGRNLGIAFQLQDDYLDAFGNPETFGKQVGGDIIENKKTYLYLKALEHSNEDERMKLFNLFSLEESSESKVEEVKGLFVKTQADKYTKDAIKDFTNKAFNNLDNLSISEANKKILRDFGNALMRRDV